MSVYLDDGDIRLHLGDVLTELRTLPDESVDCCVTSPPYWGLRDYGHTGQIGLEDTPQQYVARLVDVFREVRRVLTTSGTCWVNLGDSYYSPTATQGRNEGKAVGSIQGLPQVTSMGSTTYRRDVDGLKPKDLVGIPWRVAFALQADGWWLRSDVIWAKPNPMPESVRDRPTKAHEYVFLLTKADRYWYDGDAIREEAVMTPQRRHTVSPMRQGIPGQPDHTGATEITPEPARQYQARNARSVWTIATQPYPEAHFAVFPEELPRRCILAGCPEGGTVLDPFTGSGTTLYVARKHGRRGIGIELNLTYAELAARRLQQLSLLGGAA